MGNLSKPPSAEQRRAEVGSRGHQTSRKRWRPRLRNRQMWLAVVQVALVTLKIAQFIMEVLRQR